MASLKYNSDYYLKNKEASNLTSKLYYETHKEEQKLQMANNRRKVKERLVSYFCNKCAICNGIFPQCVFDFHHLNPMEKSFRVSGAGGFERCLKEAMKCIMLCANCHRTIHTEIPVHTEISVK